MQVLASIFLLSATQKQEEVTSKEAEIPKTDPQDSTLACAFPWAAICLRKSESFIRSDSKCHSPVSHYVESTYNGRFGCNTACGKGLARTVI